MKNFMTEAINLKTYPLGEADNIVVMYSKEKGIIRGVAKGVKKQQSRLGGRMDVLVANKLLLYKSKSLDTICEAQALNTFKNLRRDLDKLFYSIYIAELVFNFGIEDDSNAEETYNLLYKTLEIISNCSSKKDILLKVLKFQLKYMQILGYGLEFENCLICSKLLNEEQVCFSSHTGGVVCPSCRQGVAGVSLHFKIRKFLLTLQGLDLDVETQYDRLATERICEFCFGLLKDYINIQAPKYLKTAKTLEAMEF